MYLLIISLPLMSSIFGSFLGEKLGPKGAGILTSSCIVLTSILSIICAYEVGICGSPVYLYVSDWINSEMFDANWGFQFDALTVSMLVLVSVVSSLVHIYSTGYMSEDPHQPRFYSYLSLFTFFMIVLVTGDNLVSLFLGWEGVGLCSYLLINFWFTRLQANKAAIKAMVVNRIGDFGFALGIFGLFYMFKSIEFSTIFSMIPVMIEYSTEGVTGPILGLSIKTEITILCLLLFVGAIGKSAQIGLHTWLPDAMEGPTPVSALIHAATMVTAGVFMIIRCSPLYEQSPFALFVITILGASTAFFAATTGLVQNDLKKVIAYSTCSQLGYMVFSCGLSTYSVSLFHLLNHGYFKALLFLSAGSVIHAVADQQDMRQLGGLRKFLPFTYSAMLIGSLSLMGFPFLTGFYSKDVILEIAFASYSVSGSFAHWLGCISAFFTSFYSFRLLYNTFIKDTNIPRSILEHVHDAPLAIGLPLFILAYASIFVGYLTRDMMIGLGTNFWNNSLAISIYGTNSLLDAEFLPYYIKLIPVIFSIVGAGLALYLYHACPFFLYKLTFHLRPLYIFLSKKWFFDKVYNDYVVPSILAFGYSISFKLLDKGLIEYLGPLGLASLFTRLAATFSRYQTGYIYHYGFSMFLGFAFFLVYFQLASSVLNSDLGSRDLVALILVLILSVLVVLLIAKDSTEHLFVEKHKTNTSKRGANF
jgi:NADH-ubiquinone oxidoreductase chain 5